jgi:glutamate-1-semialdehyde 2,1-aminomutase
MNWFERASAVIPGGVNSPVRAFKAVGGRPPFIASGDGARVTTIDGNELIDFIASWGALIHGHAHPVVIDAITEAAGRGTSFGVPTTAEVELAELMVEMVPSVDVVRMVNSGTEATGSAVRLARAATERSEIIKFAGSYHGHADPFLVQAGSGLATFGTPSSPGVPEATVGDTRVADYNDLESVGAQLTAGRVAAVIVEPVAGNMGCVPPADGFLPGLRELCDRHGALLIFDEVMTGFRVGPGSAQGRFGVTPDLTTMGPDGPVYQAGTLAGNPLATSAGLATLRWIQANDDVYDRFDDAGRLIEFRLGKALDRAGLPGVVQAVGGMVGVFLGIERATTWSDVADLDGDLFNRFFHAALRRGVLLPPSPFEAWFLMEAHMDGTLDIALTALEESIAEAAG